MKHLGITLLLFAYSFNGFNQCPECIINNTCISSPITPVICPIVAPEASLNANYNQDFTLFLPHNYFDEETGFNVTLSAVTIFSVTGLPEGLSLTLNESDSIYTLNSDSTTQRGCFRICGIPAFAGNYMISINAVHSITSPISAELPQSYALPISVVPSNYGFNISDNSGCDSLTTDFQALITNPMQPVLYSWDFGNGNVSSDFSPESQLYISPGIYPVSLEAQILDFVITEINFNTTGTAWCGDVEEISLPFIGCTGSPDIYCNLTSGGVSNSTTIVNNSLVFNRPNLNILAFDNVFTIQFYDADSISQDDNLGSSIIQFSSPGTYSFSTIEGNGTVTIETQPGSIYNFTDSVFVYSIPEQILIFEDILTGNLIYSPELQYSWKWLFNGDTIEGTSNLAIFQPTIPGEYSVIVFNGDCVAFSNVINYTMVNVSDLVHAFEVFPVPYQSGMLQIELNSSSTENIQINLYDSQGKLLQSQIYKSGSDVLNFNPGELSGGIYFLQIGSGGKSLMHKLPVAN